MKRKSPTPGFTLIELLASMSVLAILMTVMSQTVGMVSSSWLSGKARIDAFTQARVTLGALDRDLQRMVLRPDLAAFTDSTGANSALAFYTRVQGVHGDRAVSLVEYQMQTPDSEPHLVRNDYGMDFGGTNSLSFGQNASLPDLTRVAPRELAPNVVRLNWVFLDRNGAESDHFIFDYDNPDADTNTRVIRVSMLVLDSSAYNLLTKNPASLSALLSQTSGTPQQGESVGAYWQRLISTSALSGSVPRPVIKSLRVFERSITIPVNR
jgi:prepilin-type N-terminal cleavage/methylation domain-containing protein